MTQPGRSNWGSLSACLRIAVVCLLPALLATCGEDASGPSGSPVVGRIEFTHGPLLSGGFFGPNLPIDRVHVIIARPPAGDIVKDTIRNFDPNQNQLRLDLPILLRAAAESLDVTLELLSGTTVLFNGTSRLEAHAGPPSTSPPPAIPLTYSGPGSQIAQLQLAPLDSTLGQGDSLTMRVTGLDGGQLPISAFYVGWSSSDTAVARVNGAGVVRGRVSRGTVFIRARTPNTLLFPTGIVESTTVTLVPDPSTIIKLAGDNQTGAVGTALAQLLEVEIRASDNLPVPGVTVTFATSDVGASVDSATATTNANGIARTGAVLGTVPGTQSFTASATGLSSVTFNATATAAPTPTWTGAVSINWNDPGNWNTGAVPVPGDSVTIPAGTPFTPDLTTNVSIGALLNNSVVNLGTFFMTVSGNLRGTGSISGSSNSLLVVNAPATLIDIPAVTNLTVSGTSVSLNRNLTVSGQLIVSGGGNLSFATHAVSLSGDFSTLGGGTITMASSQDTLRVGGDVLFNGGSTFGLLSSGAIVAMGDFTQVATGSARSYAPTGNHIDIFAGPGVQTITFTTPGATESNFETLAIANSAGGVTIASNLFISGPVGFAPGVPRIAHGGGQTLFVAELLAANATLDNILVAANNVLITQFDTINFINYSPAATPLTISHPGSATPFVFNGLTFGVTPTSGKYISVTDLVADANVLTINLVNPTPGTGAPFIQTAGGAVVNWPFVPAGARIWTGAVDTDWFTAGNWSPAIVPGPGDDVVIPATAAAPVLNGGAGVHHLTIQPGATLTSNSDLDVSGDAVVNGAFLGSGIIVMSTHGSSVAGNISNLEIDLPTRFESILVSGTLSVSGLIEVIRGHFDLNGHTVTTGDFATISEGMLKMVNPGDALVVNGDADFGGEDPTGVLTAGTIRVRRNFVQQTGVTQGSFVATGSNRVILDGTGPQVISFQHPGASHFQDLELANVSDTLFMGSDWAATGQLIQTGVVSVVVAGAGQLITTSGVAMGSGEFHNARVTIGGGTVSQFDNISWTGFSPFLVQLNVSRPSGTFSFTNHTFATTPSTGFYLRADDTNPSDGQPLTINMVNPTPGTPGSFVQALNGAVVNWPAAAGGTAVWTGAVNSDWFNTGNWSTGTVPTAADDVDFTAFFTNAPSINANTAIHNLAVSSGRFITVNSGDTLTITGDAVLNGTITGPGAVDMAGNGGLVSGVFPNLRISGSYTLGGTLEVHGTFLTVQSDLTVGANSIILFANLNVIGSGRLIMTNPNALVSVQGFAVFDGASTVGSLTAGLLAVTNNFTQTATTSSNSFTASGSHLTLLNGPGLQVVSFASPTVSAFQNLQKGGTGSLTIGSDIRVLGTFTSVVSGTITGAGRKLTTSGLSSANVTFDHVLIEVSTTLGGSLLSITNTTFQNYPSTATQLSIVHPGLFTPATFDGLTFSSTPTTGFYVSATDQNPSDGLPLTINVTNTTPSSGSPFVQTAAGAVVNWPSGPTPVVTWTGAVSTDWAVPGNWSSGVVPSVSDSVVIPAGGNQPILTSSALAGALHLANGTLTLNGQFMAVARTFVSTGSGRLVMTDPNDGLSISGDAIFDGGNQLGFMSDGVIVIAGDLTQLATNSPDSYHPSGNHTTALFGSNPTITFTTPGLVPGSSHFQRLDWTGTGTLTLGSNVFAHAELFVASGSPTSITGNGRTITAGGFFGATSATTFDNVNMVIDQASSNPLTVSNLIFTNQDPAAVQLSIRHPGTFPGGVTTQSVTFQTTPSTGFYLRAEDTAPVDGTVLTVEVNNPTPVTPGTFVQTAGGAIVNWPGSGGSGGTSIWSGASDTDWNNPGNWSGGIPINTSDVIIPSGMPNYPVLQTNETVTNVLIQPGAFVDLTGGTLVIFGDLTGGGDMPNGAPIMGGTGVSLAMGSLGGLEVSGDVTLAGDITISGDVSIQNSGSFTLGGFDVDISGNLNVINGATLVMNDPLTHVTVQGDVLFDGGSEAGLLTDGLLEVQGDFTQANSTSTSSFRGTGSFQVLMNGPASQSVTFADSLLSFFRDLTLSGTAGYTVFGVPTVTGNLIVSPGVTVDANNLSFAGDGFNVGGNVTTGLGSLLHLGRLYIGGTLTVGGTYNTTSVIFTGTGQTAPAGLPYQFLYSRGNVTFGAGNPTIQTLTVEAGTLTLAARTQVSSDVFISGGTLKPNGHTIAIGGALNVLTTGTLTMQNALDSVLVTGFAGFGGGSTVGLLTNGVLRVGGSFTQTSGTSSTSFAASGNHKTIIGAGAVRVVNFATPGTGGAGSHFADIDVTAGSGDINLSSNIFADGAFISLPTATAPTIVGAGKLITAMSLNVTRASGTSLILENAPLIVNEQGTARTQVFDRAFFSQYPVSATLMDMTLVGSNAVPRSLTFQAPNLQTSVTNLYAKLVSSNGQSVTLTISGSNDPTGGPSKSDPPFGTTVNGARIVWQ